MTKGQKAYTLPKEFAQELDLFLEKHRDVLSEWGIEKRSDLVKATSKRGLKQLLAEIEQIYKIRTSNKGKS